jgi:hypothetical protein
VVSGADPRWPTFLVIGAYKAGTTTVHHALRAHPDVFVPLQKEPSFFAFADAPDPASPAYERAVRDEAAYTALFADAGTATAVGEVSPEYLVNPEAPAAIAQRCPNVELIAVLRNPVDRAWSDWLMYVRDGRERDDFARALTLQEQRQRAGEPTGHYLSTGEYADQLVRYLARFPREQLHVWLYDDLDSNPDRVMREMFTALGVDPHVSPTTAQRHNVGGVPSTVRDRVLLGARNRYRPVLRRLPLAGLRRRVSSTLDERLVRPSIDPDVRATLLEHFRQDIERVQELLDRDLSIWMRPA